MSKPKMLLKLSPMLHDHLRASIQVWDNERWHGIGKVSWKHQEVERIMKALRTEYELSVSGRLAHPASHEELKHHVTPQRAD